MRKGLDYVQDAVEESDNKDHFREWREKLVKYEEISDRIEYEIINYLNKINRDGLTDASVLKIKSMYRIAGEMESLGDSGEAISRLLGRGIEHSCKLGEEHKKQVNAMIALVARSYDAMVYNLENESSLENIDNAVLSEVEINSLRDSLREKELDSDGRSGESYFESVLYLSLLEELEKMGDFIINISQALMSTRRNEAPLSSAWDD